jgi:cellulose synthase/poly-beta-1,6-N-acetylglucosamine synthase-like glycosyltransferase
LDETVPSIIILSNTNMGTRFEVLTAVYLLEYVMLSGTSLPVFQRNADEILLGYTCHIPDDSTLQSYYSLLGYNVLKMHAACFSTDTVDTILHEVDNSDIPQ